MKTILIMGAGASEIPAIKSALNMGLKVVLVDRNENAPGFRIPGVIRVVNSIAEKEKILEIAKDYNIDGIVTFVDSGVRSVAYVAAQLHLPGLSEKSAFLGTDKIAMRKRLKEYGVPIPKFYSVTNKEELYKAVSKFEKRCVIKAPDSAGSRGIFLLNDVNDKQQIEYAFSYCMENSGTIGIMQTTRQMYC